MTRPDDYGIVAACLRNSTITDGKSVRAIDEALAALERLAADETCCLCDAHKLNPCPRCLNVRRDCLAKVKGEK